MTNPPPDEPQEWMPRTREDWIGIFSDGMLSADQKRAEAEAERIRLEQEQNPPPKNDDIPPKKLTFAEKLLGNK